MKYPDVKNLYIDKQNDITYKIRAYRKLTRVEKLIAIGRSLSQKRNRPKLTAGDTVVTWSALGSRGKDVTPDKKPVPPKDRCYFPHLITSS